MVSVVATSTPTCKHDYAARVRLILPYLVTLALWRGEIWVSMLGISGCGA